MTPTQADSYPYFTLFEEIGLINSNTRINYSTLTVTEDMLNRDVPAREYLYMVYNMLFVPNVNNGCYGGTIDGFKYIDYFIDYRKGDLSHWEDSSYKITT